MPFLFMSYFCFVFVFSQEESDVGIELPLTETVYIKNEKSVVSEMLMCSNYFSFSNTTRLSK